MPDAQVLIGQVVLASAQSSVSFTNLPQIYGDLRIVLGGVTNSVNANMSIRLNLDAGSNYSYVNLVGNGSTATSDGSAADTAGYVLFMSPASTATGGTTDILDYTATDKHKMILTDRSHSQDRVIKTAQRWASLNAVTSLLLFPGSGSFQSGSTFTLYGVSA